MRRLAPAVALLLAALGCANAAPAAPDPAPPDSSPVVALHIGEKAQIRGGIVLTFVGVAQDSRCPKGVQCISAGKAVLLLEATPRNGDPVAFQLDTMRARDREIAGFFVELRSLEPHPVSDRSIAPGEYVARLSVRQSAPAPTEN